jgi:hypothetical protein
MKSLLLVTAGAALLVPVSALAQPVPDDPDPLEDEAMPEEEPIVVDPYAPPVTTPATTPPEPPPTTVVVETEDPPVLVVNPSDRMYETDTVESFNTPVFTAGAIIFGASYGASVIGAAAMEDEDNDAWDNLYIPLVGPWLTLDELDDCRTVLDDCNGDSTTEDVLLVTSGIVQGAGVLTMAYGLLVPEQHTVTTVRTAKLDTRTRVKPIATGRMTGLAISGRF